MYHVVVVDCRKHDYIAVVSIFSPSLTILKPQGNLYKLHKHRIVSSQCIRDFVNKTHQPKLIRHWEGPMCMIKVKV
jgi:hypothetical protein